MTILKSYVNLLNAFVLGSIMDDKDIELRDEDIRDALKEIQGYVDVTEEDLIHIYRIALRHAKERLSWKLPVKDAMTTDVVTIKKDADIHEASRLLSEHRVSGLPVVDDENHVIGIITEADVLSMVGLKRGHTFRDIVKHLLGEPMPERRAGSKVEDIMTSPPITARPDDDIKVVAKILDDKRIKRLPVVDVEGKLTGIISRADIVRVMGNR